MPKPVRNALVTVVTYKRTAGSNENVEDRGQSVQRQTVRSMTTKDSAGTFPVTCYETKAGDPKPVDFARLARTEEEISSDQSNSPAVSSCEGTIVYKGIQPPKQTLPFYLARLSENMYAVENPAVKAT